MNIFTKEFIEKVNNRWGGLDARYGRKPAIYWVSLYEGASILRNLKIKIKKYEQLQLPLIVAVVNDPFTSFKTDDLEDVLYGKREFFVQTDDKGQNRLLQIRSKERLFDDKPSLSAVLWINRKQKRWIIRAFSNEKATNPIPNEMLNRLETMSY